MMVSGSYPDLCGPTGTVAKQAEIKGRRKEGTITLQERTRRSEGLELRSDGMRLQRCLTILWGDR
jgi:hypothetical protein